MSARCTWWFSRTRPTCTTSWSVPCVHATPRWLLGPPPDWYKSRAYRSRVVREPRSVLREFGTEIADDREVRVHDSTADMRYLVLPMRPDGTDGMSEADLAALVGRDTMIGVAEVAPPVRA